MYKLAVSTVPEMLATSFTSYQHKYIYYEDMYISVYFENGHYVLSSTGFMLQFYFEDSKDGKYLKIHIDPCLEFFKKFVDKVNDFFIAATDKGFI